MAYHRTSVARAPAVNRTVERARRLLPVNQYLYMLHTGATTGYFPRLDTEGHPIPRDTDGKDDLSTHERVALTETLLSKVMPDAKYEHEPDAIEATLVQPDEIQTLPSEKLQRLLAPDTAPEGMFEDVHVRPM